MKSKPAISTDRDLWRKAFPVNEAQRATKFLYDTWESLVASKPKAFCPTLRENQHTERLYKFLAGLSEGKGRLTGFWHYEVPEHDFENEESDDLKIINRTRKDITYTSNEKGKRLELIFEFKKLSDTALSRSQYRGKNGMRRFVDGHYARGLPLALMVGMIIGDDDACVDGLKLSMQSKASLGDLRMVLRDKTYLFEPSTIFPGVATFDTEHNRPTDMAPSHGTMLLSHMFVSMPKEE